MFNSYNDILSDNASLCNLYSSSAVCHALKFIYISNLKKREYIKVLQSTGKNKLLRFKSILDSSQGFHLTYHSFLHIAPFCTKYKISQRLEGKYSLDFKYNLSVLLHSPIMLLSQCMTPLLQWLE